MIFSSRYVLTFDNHLYEHPGFINSDCTYLLATDYVDNNFTLFSSQNNIFLALKGIHMKMTKTNVVYFGVNGEFIPKNIPFQNEDMTVTIVHEGPWVNITSTYGVKVCCNADQFLCTISLSSWYHGKTRGLLGNLDREARTDRIKPNGENATDIIDFVNAYEISGSSECQINRFNRPVVDVPGCNHDNRNALEGQCAQYFTREDSALKPAFKTISPTEWRQECMSLAHQCKDVCKIAMGYIHMARTKDIDIVDPCGKLTLFVCK